jgi:hypothetical protein
MCIADLIVVLEFSDMFLTENEVFTSSLVILKLTSISCRILEYFCSAVSFVVPDTVNEFGYVYFYTFST